MVGSQLDYASSIWAHHEKKLVDKLNRSPEDSNKATSGCWQPLLPRTIEKAETANFELQKSKRGHH